MNSLDENFSGARFRRRADMFDNSRVIRGTPRSLSMVRRLAGSWILLQWRLPLLRNGNPHRPQPVSIAGLDLATFGLQRQLRFDLKQEEMRGVRALGFACVFLIGFAGLIPFSGAVIVHGGIVVSSGVKKVQHQQGGIVHSILASEGTSVVQGQPVIRLDQTAARANLQILARQLDETRLRVARLKAERDGEPGPRWPTLHAAEIDPADRSAMLASERTLFLARTRARHNQLELSHRRLEQLAEQLVALEAQLKSNAQQGEIARAELTGIEHLLREKLVTLPRATALRREAAQLDGMKGQLTAQIAESRLKESETRLQFMREEQDAKSEVMRDLREAEAREGELVEREIAARDQMARTVIRAPASGTVHEMALHTVGGVVSPGEVLMLVVPDNDLLEVNAKLAPDKIDQVSVGQSARARLMMSERVAITEIAGTVKFISPDASRDASTGTSYYNVRIQLAPSSPQRAASLQLHPGMGTEVFLETETRTLLSYLLKPLTEQMTRMFRER